MEDIRNIKMCVPCLLGVEAPIAAELAGIGARNVRSENGRVFFEGGADTLADANIRSRCAERVLIVVASFEAHTFDELFDGTKAARWDEWIGKTDRFPVKGYSLNSDLFSVSDCQSIIKKAVVESLREKYRIPWFEETGALYQIQFSIMKNVVTLYIDTSGAALHKRGYRPAANAAPIKETLAAAICDFARLQPYHTLYDPMCGSGTIVIEGAMKAMNIAPGVNRGFSFEDFGPDFAAAAGEARERARSLVREAPEFTAFASDIDPSALRIARENAKRAGVAGKIRFEVADVADFKLRTEKGTIITNPPYGERMSDIRSAETLYETMGKVFPRGQGRSCSVITADEDFEKYFGAKADRRRKLYNGMIKCGLYMYFK